MISSKALASAIAWGNKGLIICGNGGSMAQAQHMAAETIGAGRAAMALSDPAVLSALTNDEGYLDTFRSYLRPFEGKFGYFLGLTTSGSANVMWAAHEASNCGMKVTIISGKTLTPNFVDLHIRIDGDTQEIQEWTLEWIHDFYAHLKEEICRFEESKLVREALATS
jgi:D-sedoheptulose 7-phosphate isomerase